MKTSRRKFSASYPKALIDDTIDCGNKENLEILANKVEYKNLTLEGRIEMNPFIKKG